MAYRLINIDSLISDNIRIYMRLCISPVFSREERRNGRHRQDLRSHIYEVWRTVEQERPKRRANGTAGEEGREEGGKKPDGCSLYDENQHCETWMDQTRANIIRVTRLAITAVLFFPFQTDGIKTL